LAVAKPTDRTVRSSRDGTISSSLIVEGYHDGADCTKIYGWSWDSAQPNTPISVDIYDGSNKIASVLAGDFRSDLTTKGNGYHAFNYTTPATLKDGQTHTITVKFANTQFNLNNTPKTLGPCSSLLAAPTLSAPSNGATGVSVNPTFSWSSVSGANRNWLTVATSASTLPTDPNATSCSACVISGNTDGTSYTTPNAFPYAYHTATLNPGTTYYWRVQGWNTNGMQGNYSSIFSFTTASGSSLLTAPNLSAPANGATGVSVNPTFSWSSVSGANRYWLTVATSAATLPTDPNATSCSACVISGNTDGTSYTSPNAFPYAYHTATLNPGTTYYWRVQGWNTNGTQGNYSSIFSFTTGGPSLLPAPILSAPSNGASGVSTTPTFSWSSVSGATKYWITVATSSGTLPTDPNALNCPSCVIDCNVTTTSHTGPSCSQGRSATLANNTTYFWRVQGYDNSVSPTQQGQFSSIFSFTTGGPSLLPAPILSAPSNGASGVSTTPTFSWSSVSGATKYWITVATSSGTLPTDPNALNCPSCVIDCNVTTTSHTGPSCSQGRSATLANNTTYFWRVQGYDNSVSPTQQGQFSSIFSFTTANPGSTLPTISNVSPSSYPPSSSNQTMTINGSNFQSGATLTFFPPEGGTIPSTASKLTFVSNSQISYQFNNANDIGTWSVSVNNPSGQSSNTVSFTVQSLAVPALTGYNWNTTPTDLQNFSGMITGTGFIVTGTRVFFCVNGTNTCYEHPQAGIIVNNSNSLSVSNVNLGSGSYQVYVQTPGGSSNRSTAFTVSTSPTAQPVIDVSPGSGPLGTAFRFTGSNFTRNSTATLIVTRPGGSPGGSGRYSTDSNGNVSFAITSQSTDPLGLWTFVLTDDGGKSASATTQYTNTQQTGTDSMYYTDSTVDVNYPDGSQITAASPFTKTWRLQNNGTTTWNGYTAVFISNPSNGNPSVNLNSTGITSVSVPLAAPGQTINLSIPMKAPSPGTYYSYWQLQNTSGVRFGKQFYVLIRVVAKQGNALGFGSQSGKSGTNDSPPAKFATNSDPVNTATGNYNYAATDLRVPGRGLDVELSRSYNSQDSTFGPLGNGWSHSFNIYLANITSASASVHYSDGKVLDYINQPGTSSFTSSYPGFYDTLIRNSDGTWTLKKTDQKNYQFDASGKLTRIQDRDNNQISLSYSGGNLAQVTDTVGRAFNFTYSGSLLTSLTDSGGRNLQFSYDTNSNLISFRDANGNTNSYTYDSSNQLTRIVDGRGNNLVVNSYTNNCPVGVTSCVGTQTNGRGNQWTFVYNADGSTSVFDPFNKESKYLQDVNFNIQQTQDRNANTQFASGPVNLRYDESNNRARTSDANGNYAAYVYDQNGNITSRTDPTLNLRQAVYDSKNNPIQITDEMGKTTQMAYDNNGNLTTLSNALGNSSSTTYDSFGQPISVTDESGNVSTRTYDAQGNLVSVKDALNNTTTYAYDTIGRRMSMTDARGKTTRYTYDANDNLLTVTDPLNNVTSYNYDANNNRTSVRDPRGNTTTYTYDENNLLTKEIDAKGNFIQHTYDKLDRRISTRDRRGNVTNLTYDNEGRLLTATDLVGNTTSYAYDANGNRTKITDAKGQSTAFTYDGLNRVTKIQDSLGNTIQKEYDKAGRLTKETDPRGNATQFSYDAIGNLTQVNDAAAGSAKYTYDKNRNRITQTDPNNHTSNLAYDKVNRLLLSKDPLNNSYSSTYDEVGNGITRTDAKGQTTRYTYDDDNRLKLITYPNNSSVQLTYDANGNINQMADALGTTSYVYDELNRMTSYSDPFGKTIGYQYDANGNIAKLTYPDGKQLTYQYDANNRLISLTDWANKTTSYEYDGTNLLTKVTYPNGITTNLTYDNAGRLTAKSDAGISSYSFTLDPKGNRTNASITQPLANRLQNTTQSYTYDAANRIQNAGAATFGFDANSNMTTKTEAGQTTTYTYDFENRLTAVSGSSQYSYNGQGVRLQKIEGTKTTRYVVDINHDLSQVLCETDANGAITSYYVYGIGLSYKVMPDGTHYYYHSDPIGSTIAMTDDARNIVNSYAYDPFGRVTHKIENTSNSFQFIGQFGVMLEANGLILMRDRFYEPNIGRFITRDRLPEIGVDTQSQNLFAYAGNEPINRIDPSGRWWNPLPALGKMASDFAHGTSAAVNSLVLSGATLIKSPVDLLNFVTQERIPLVGSALDIAKAIQKRAAYNMIGDNAKMLGISISEQERWEMADQVTKVTDIAAFLLQLPTKFKTILTKGGDLKKAYVLIDTIKGTLDASRDILSLSRGYEPIVPYVRK
jgi:RHS repeat-associated protein